MNSLDDLIREKSALLMEVQIAKSRKSTRDVVTLSSRAGTLEMRVALSLLAAGKKAEAVINLVSAGSCYIDARRDVEAKRALMLALTLSEQESITAETKTHLEKIGNVEFPGSLFSSARVHVRGNPKLRKPQIGAYEAALHHFAKSNEHAIIQLPVGCGKTGTMAMLPFGLSKLRALVVAPNLEIARNLQVSFDYSTPQSFLRQNKVLQNGKGPTCAVWDSEANISDSDASDFVVANIQQIVASGGDKWLSQLPPNYFDLILFDEGHHNAAESWQTIEKCFPKAKVASFTATPIRADGKKVEGVPIYRFPIAEAIREGYVKNIATRRLEPTSLEFVCEGSNRVLTLAEVVDLREEDWFSKGIALAPECNRNIVDAAIQCMEELRGGSGYKHQIIAAACSIDHARSICSLFRERKLSADLLHSRQSDEEQSAIRNKLKRLELDVIVHVNILSEGADYPSLGVAAVFRPYRHLVPYVQFVGRIMRVLKQNAPGDIDNRGFVVSHVGLHIDRWWDELRALDKDDQSFFETLGNGSRDFELASLSSDNAGPRQRFSHPMKVLDEQIEYFVQEHFIDLNDAKIMVEDLIHAMQIRGISLNDLGVTQEEIANRLVERGNRRMGRLEQAFVQPQTVRQEARRRLDERVKAGAKQLLNELQFKVGGRKLTQLYPKFQTNADLPTAIILLNQEVQAFLNVGDEERDLLTPEQLKRAHDEMDTLIDNVAQAVRSKMSEG